ncbi:hypothetical protein GCM10027615_59170 [Plantactinospora veratri]
MLKTIERTTGQRISIDKIPSVADLRTRRLEMTRAALHESLLEDDLDPFRVIVETLTDEFDVMEVALAAVKLAHESAGGPVDEEEDIPQVAFRTDRDGRARRDGGRDGGRDDRRAGRPRSGDMACLFIGVGRRAGIRPQDLVGAITGETAVSGREIGSIEIADRFSLVEVPRSAANEVIARLRQSTIKGRKATVRRDREVGRDQREG